ncbi:hypothetical protein LzC2_06960 [Planctomycetes bacterium LzC2]|uniref:Uncharacterized protein n=2 Tax=Alienimonas chondri TaxID=2681879 RepID=A0ABX1V9R3_9PLAN|nr:hypothetical protein [Alienimonas chondri]
MDAWWTALHDLPADALRAAVKRFIMTADGNDWPTPGTIRQMAVEFRDGRPESSQETVGRIFEAVRRFGIYEPESAKKFIGPLGWAAVKNCNGWAWCCELKSENRGIYAAQLRKAVEALRERELEASLLPTELIPPVRSPSHSPVA